MTLLSVDLKNCFGIKSLEKTFNFSNGNVFAVYSQNGTMKTSFTKVFKAYQNSSAEDDIKDLVFNEPSTHSISINGNHIDSHDIFTIGSLDERYQSENISKLLLDITLQNDFFEVLELRFLLLRELKVKTGLTIPNNAREINNISKLESKFLKDFGLSNNSFLDSLLEACLPAANCLQIEYKDLFDNGASEKFIESANLQSFIDDFLHKTDEIYSTTKADGTLKYSYLAKGGFSLGAFQELAKTAKNTKFLEGNNGFILDGESKDKDEFNAELQEVLGEIRESNEFKKITTELSKNKTGTFLLSKIESDPTLVIELKNITQFRKSFWSEYLEQIKTSNDDNLFELLKTKYLALKSRITDDLLDGTKWKEAVDIFNERFSMPFSMDIGNLENSIFGEAPIIEFKFYKDGDKNNDSPANVFIKDKNSILESLSQGEKRALYLLNIIFDIEAIKQEVRNAEVEIPQKLLVIDDIADSFDYKNKYAIIEYLRDTAEFEVIPANGPQGSGNEVRPFNLIVLTHNFDFYRTVSARLKVASSNKLHSEISGDEIKLEIEQYQEEPFNAWKENLTAKNIIALIPFVRNLIEYGKNISEHFMLLTHLLHKKNELPYDKFGKRLKVIDGNVVTGENNDFVRIYDESPETGDFVVKASENITFADIQSLYTDYLGSSRFPPETLKKTIISEITIVANNIQLNNSSLEYKIILAIAIRLEAERFMIPKILSIPGITSWRIDKIERGQTANLIKSIKGNQRLLNISNETLSVLDSVNVMTPENIHLNSFMYEPILDMGIGELKNLYDKTKALNTV